jgi:hypothetical protein
MDNIMNNPPPLPSWRKPVGMMIILAIIAFCAIIVVGFSDHIARLPVLAQAVVYMIAGVIWIAPLRPLLIWMETGSFKPPRQQ